MMKRRSSRICAASENKRKMRSGEDEVAEICVMKIQMLIIFYLTVIQVTRTRKVILKLMSVMFYCLACRLVHLPVIYLHSYHPPTLEFTAKQGMNTPVQDSGNVMAFDDIFFTEEFFQHVADQTNLYAAQAVDAAPHPFTNYYGLTPRVQLLEQHQIIEGSSCKVNLDM
ncbi:hypothetical protein PR048_029115 [Dryococelus australis]|uniref:Uncharacterized protein n=1 Tax=Dryococelus australis TaxID=614101 RepID=A0ABQ9GF83_9NEOP|nr:hypothetical protein PR048_029115 [Dryococelus australis]